jgi:hypothetical protein
MMPIRSVVRCVTVTAVVVAAVACDARFDPGRAVIPEPTILVPSTAFGLYALRLVDDTPLPHVTTRSSTSYTLTSGTLNFKGDSTWLYSSVTQQPGPNGTTLTSPANYIGRWTVSDTAIEFSAPPQGSRTLKGDTVIWIGGPRFSWEPPLRFTLVRP